MRRLSVAIRALRGGRWTEIRDVGQAQIELMRAQAMQWLRPLGELVEVTNTDSTKQTATAPSSEQAETCERLSSAIIRATRYGVFRPLCLARAVALSRMLNAHGVVGHRIRIGVRREDGSFTAHAWVQLGDLILGDTESNTLAYSPLTQVSVTGDTAFSGIAPFRDRRAQRGAGNGLSWDQ